MNRSHTPSSSTLPQTSPRAEISDYYDDTLLDYDMWSPEGYLHFGYWRPYLNPFVRRPMLEEMNRFIFQHLGLADWHEGAVADLGCGVGAVSRFGSQLYPQLEFHAMSISPGQIASAQQRHAVSTLGELVNTLARERLGSPAVIVVGDVVRGVAAASTQEAIARSA